MTDTTVQPNVAPGPNTAMICASICSSLGLMSSEEVSGVLQVSPQTLATWRCKRRGPPSIKLGKKVFYLITDFSAWMQNEAKKQQEVKSPAPRAAHTTSTYNSESLKEARENF